MMLRVKNECLRPALICLVAVVLSGCRQEVRFTRMPTPVPAALKLHPKLTTIYVGAPIQLDRLREAALKEVPESLGRVVDWIDDAACYTRRGRRRCRGARVDVALRRDGDISIDAAGTKLQIRVPLAYDLKARGLGPARTIRDAFGGKLVATAQMEIQLGAGLTPQVSMGKAVHWSVPKIAVLEGELDIAALASGRIRSKLKALPAILEESLAANPINETVAKTWKLLHAPVSLQREPDIWFSAVPKHIADGGFANHRGQLHYRVAIAARMSVIKGAAPAPVFRQQMPQKGWRHAAEEPEAGSAVRIPVDIDYAKIEEALKKAWPDPVEIAGNGETKPVRITVKDTDLYGSANRVALALELDVETADEVFDLTGKAYLSGKPAVNGKTRMLELQDIQLAKVNAIPGIGAGTGRRFRLNALPFVKGFSKAVTTDVSKQLAGSISWANSLFDQPIGEGLRLRADFKSVRVGEVQAGRDSFRIGADIQGEVMITRDDQRTQVGAARAQSVSK